MTVKMKRKEMMPRIRMGMMAGNRVRKTVNKRMQKARVSRMVMTVVVIKNNEPRLLASS